MANISTNSSSNLLGLGNIVNKDFINKNINLKTAELDLLSNISSHSNKSNDYKKEIYNKNIKEIAAEIGIDIDNISDVLEGKTKDVVDVNTIKEDVRERPSSVVFNSYDKYDNRSEIKATHDKRSVVEPEPLRNDYPSLQERFFNRATNNPEKPASNVSYNNKPVIKEQVKHDVFSNVLHEIKPNPEYTHDIYIEEVKNKKSMLLEQIQMLKLMLQEEGEDMTSIDNIVLTENDSIDKINHIYMILKIKKDRIQFNTLGEEIIMFGVHMLENFFDGNRVFFGRFSPDLTGWHNSVSIKLRRLKMDTCNVVSNIVQTYNISYGTRLCLELIPSMFLYSKVRSSCKNKESKKYTSNDIQDNLSSIDL